MNMKRCGNYIIIWVGFTILTFSFMILFGYLQIMIG